MAWGRCCLRVLVVAVACVAAVPAARAQQLEGEAAEALRDREARTLFRAGRLAYADGRYADALDAFERSYELSGRAALLFNIGAAADRLRLNDKAIGAYERYLGEVPDARNRAAVESRLEALRRAVERDRQRERELQRSAEDREALELQLTDKERELAERDDSIVTQWWLWALVGAVVAGGVTTAVLLTRDPGVQDPELGSTGQVFFTLGAER